MLHIYLYLTVFLKCSSSIAKSVSIRNTTLLATTLLSRIFISDIQNNTNMAVARDCEVKNTSTTTSGAAWESDCW